MVGEELAGALNAAYSTGRLSATMREGRIVLLHKKDDRADLGNYRPITLLNCGYKLLAKALALRLGAALASVIGPQQTAFVPSRSITDNILDHLAVVEDCETRLAAGEDPSTCSAAIAFIDFHKAYDSLSRPWLFRVLSHVGFGPRLQHWVRVMYTACTCRVAYNNFLSPAFPVDSGVRQGCPLSPALFVLAVEPLAAYLQSLQAQGRIRPHRLAGGAAVPTVAQHADDHTVVAADGGSMGEALQGVSGFEAASGLR